MQKKLNAVGYGDTCNNNINIFYTCIRIAKKRNRYRVVIKDIHLIFWNTVSNLWDFFKHLIFFLCAQVLQLCRNLFNQAPLINSVVAVVCLLSHVTFLSVCWECPGCLSHGVACRLLDYGGRHRVLGGSLRRYITISCPCFSCTVCEIDRRRRVKELSKLPLLLFTVVRQQ